MLSFQAVLSKADRDTFEPLVSFAFANQHGESHSLMATHNGPRHGKIPAAVAVAKSVNSADTGKIFPDLVHALRQKVG